MTKLHETGKPIPIRFYNMAKSVLEEFDSNFVADITSISGEKNGMYQLYLNWSEYTDHNRKISLPTFYDANSKPTLTFFETKHYPANHCDSIYLDEAEFQNHVIILDDSREFKNAPVHNVKPKVGMPVSLYVLFAQRRCSYPGEHAPEALEIMDEFGYDDNGTWLHEKLAEHKKNDSTLERLEIVKVEIDYDKIISILNPDHKVEGEVQKIEAAG